MQEQIDAVDYWMSQLANHTDSTKVSYHFYFNKFVDWIGIDPNILIKIRRQAKTAGKTPREKHFLEAKVKEFLHYLQSAGYKPATLRMALAGITSFFAENLHPLEFSSRDRPKGDSQGSRIPEKHEIVKLVNTAKSRQPRAAILLLKDSGLRIREAVRLKWSDVTDYGEGFWGFQLTTKKLKSIIYAFVGPEATNTLQHLDRKHERIFPITPKSLSNQLSKLCTAANLIGVSAQGLRMYFTVKLQTARSSREWRDMVKHKAPGPRDEIRVTKLLEVYKDAYDHLRVFGAGANLELEKIRNTLFMLKSEYQSLREQIQMHELLLKALAQHIG